MRKILFISLLVILSWHGSAFGKVYIDINSPSFQKFPIAVTDFKNLDNTKDTKNLSVWFADYISDTLKITGFFKIINRNAFLEHGNNAGITIESINFSDWSAINADFLVKGGFSCKDGKLSAKFLIFDVIEGTFLVGKEYTGSLEDRKIMVFKFVDEILSVLTGEKGVFDTKIAFVGKKGKVSEIYTVPFDGSGVEKITDYKSLTMLPYWSPAGGSMLITSYRKGNPDLYLMDLRTKTSHKVSGFPGLNLSGPWSPDGSKILMVLSKDGNEEIYTMDLNNNKLERLTRDSSIDVSPTWSPDGKKIAFASNRSGLPQIFVMDANGENVKRLTFQGSYNTSPCWSPKGGRIAYEGLANGHFQIFSIEEDGGNFIQLTFEDGGCERPSWSPDGMYIAFCSNKSGAAKIGVINSNGLNLRWLTDMKKLDSLKSPSWSSHLNLY